MTLPEGWDSGTDPATGRTYYVNHHTQQTQWDPPSVSSSAPPMYSHPDGKDGGVYTARGVVEAQPVQATAVPSYGQHAVQSNPHNSGTVTQQPSGGHTVVVLQGAGGPNPPHNVPAGGYWVQEKHCGLITWLVGIFIFPCICCCPCDDRTVYIVNGTRYNAYGAIVPAGCC